MGSLCFRPLQISGIDGIFPALLQKGLDILIETLVKILRGCIPYAYGYIPLLLRRRLLLGYY